MAAKANSLWKQKKKTAKTQFDAELQLVANVCRLQYSKKSSSHEIFKL